MFAILDQHCETWKTNGSNGLLPIQWRPPGAQCEMLRGTRWITFQFRICSSQRHRDLHQWQILAVRGSWGCGYHQATCCDIWWWNQQKRMVSSMFLPSLIIAKKKMYKRRTWRFRETHAHRHRMNKRRWINAGISSTPRTISPGGTVELRTQALNKQNKIEPIWILNVCACPLLYIHHQLHVWKRFTLGWSTSTNPLRFWSRQNKKSFLRFS